MSQEQELSDFELEQRIQDTAVSRIKDNHELFLRVIEDADLTPYIGVKEAVDILGNHPTEIASLLTFQNAHLVAEAVATSPNIDVARALYEELKYWADNGRI